MEPTTPTDDMSNETPAQDCHDSAGDNQLVDFDFRQRATQQPRKLARLQHRKSRSASTMSSVDSAEPQRSSSDASSRGSFRHRLSALVISTGPSKSQKLENNKMEPSHAGQEMTEDELPDTKRDLEMVLNYHLSELDLLKRTVVSANDLVKAAQDRYAIYATRENARNGRAMQMQWEMVQQIVTNRDSFLRFVKYHLLQLERIKDKRIEIEQIAGLQPSLPEVFKKIWTIREWEMLFIVGR